MSLKTFKEGLAKKVRWVQIKFLKRKMQLYEMRLKNIMGCNYEKIRIKTNNKRRDIKGR